LRYDLLIVFCDIELSRLGETIGHRPIGRVALVASTPQRGFEKVEQIRDADDAFKLMSRAERMFGNWDRRTFSSSSFARQIW
jgi:hypothetical protein